MTACNALIPSERFYDACRRANVPLAKELFASLADINAIVHLGCTPLLLACESRNADLVRFVLDRGAHVTHCGSHERTALHQAVQLRNNHAVLQLLLERGADVNAVDEDANQPIHVACDYDTVRFLLPVERKLLVPLQRWALSTLLRS